MIYHFSVINGIFFFFVINVHCTAQYVLYYVMRLMR